MDSMEITFQAHDVLGVLGFMLYATGYMMVSLRMLTSENIAFYLLNGLGAVCVLVSLSMNFNLGALLVNLFYMTTSIFAIAARLRHPPVWRRVRTSSS